MTSAPDKKPKIDMIVAENCRKCEAMTGMILGILRDAGMKADFKMHKVESKEAIDLALKYGLDDVPSFVVNGVPFNGVSERDKVAKAVGVKE